MGSVIGLIIFVLVFIALAPRWIRKLVWFLFLADLAGFVLVRILASLMNAGRGRESVPLVENFGLFWLMMIYAIPVLMGIGILIGGATRLLAKKKAE